MRKAASAGYLRVQKGLGFPRQGEWVDLNQVIVLRKSPETGEDWKVVFNAEDRSDIDDLHLRARDAIYPSEKW